MMSHTTGAANDSAQPWGTFAALASLALLLAAAGLMLQGTPLNVRIFLLFNQYAAQWGMLASVGSVLGLGAVPLILAGAAGPRFAVAVAAVLLALLACGLLVQGLKFAADEARPLAVLGSQVVHVVGASLRGRAMPSGHAAAGACAAAMLWAASRLEARLVIPAIVLIMIAVFEAVARLVVGAHWPSDVMAGAGLGILSGAFIFGTPASRRLCGRFAQWLCGRLGSRVLAAVLAVAAASLWQARGDYPAAAWLYLALTLLGLGAALRWLYLHAPMPAAVRDAVRTR